MRNEQPTEMRRRHYPSDLTDEQWAAIAPLLAGYDPLTADLRQMVNACLYLEKTGCPWRYLPINFGPWETVRKWRDRFLADGLWPEIAARLARALRRQRRRSSTSRTALSDPESVVSGP
ncbi:Transposase [Methylobacterium gossipiicola]|uniref:Transposase n=1 Tax=Methylobacterium gossipiicola TaxID=582675 RepID=A0A1I2UPW6_9HYPH|nr:Transposase [Methylobacterium gossipiicola]